MSAATQLQPSPAPEVAGNVVVCEEAEFRSRVGSISRQSGVYFAGTILTAAAGYFFKIYLARRLGPAALGLYALGMTIIGFIGIFDSLGLPTAAARFVAAYSAKKEMWRLGGFLRGSLALLTGYNVLLGILVVSLGPWLAVHFYHKPALNAYLWSFALIMLLGVLNSFLGQVMAGYHDVARRTVITHFIGTPATIILTVVLVSLGLGLTGYMAAQFASALVVLCLLAAAVWKMTPPEARTARAGVGVEKEVVHFSVAVFGLAGVQFVLAQADSIALGHYLEAQLVGVYAVATALVGFVTVALDAVNQIFSPVISELHAAGNNDMLQRLYSALTKWILAFTIPLALTMVFFAAPLMTIFGPAFRAGATVVAIGACAQLLNCGVGSVGYLLLMSGNQVQLVRILAVNAALMIALNWALVPRLGIAGAAIASAVTVVTTNLGALSSVRRRLGLFPYHAGYLKLVLPTCLAMGILLAVMRVPLFSASPWKLAGLGLVASYVGFLATALASGLDGDDRLIAGMVWSKASPYFRVW